MSAVEQVGLKSATIHVAGDDGGPWLKVIEGDLQRVAGQAIPPSSIAAAVFSPPYKDKDGFALGLMDALGVLLQHVFRPGARGYMNFGQLKEEFWRPFRAALALLAASGGQLEEGQTIVWIKSYAKDSVQHGHFQPLNTQKVLNYAHEYVFTFWRPPEPDFDRLSIGVPYTDKSNLKRGTRGKNGDNHCAGDVWVFEDPNFDAWYVPYKTTGATEKKKHAYEFPEELARRCLVSAGLKPGDTIYEPFLGSGTTAVVAKRLGLNVWATERDPETIKVALERWKAEK